MTGGGLLPLILWKSSELLTDAIKQKKIDSVEMDVLLLEMKLQVYGPEGRELVHEQGIMNVQI
jgi:hypothetical protein